METCSGIVAYGMSEYKLSDTLQIPVEQASYIIDKFFESVPKVKHFLERLKELGISRGFIRTGNPYSRIRWFPTWQQAKEEKNIKELESIGRQAKNTPMQGANGNVIKLALIKVQEEIDKNNWPVKILLSVYDEIQTECKEDKAKEWCTKLEQIMIDSAKEFIKSIPVIVDCKIADCWSK